ncbi:hypothetical protein [Novipirellula artificiosorum]|uniref:Uncharacterized protein n=1 Tax=Novipirellula artificiosorum TaxID=2528016 RepID=A0A5C6DES8_9BACT|nr:hypothetical protein [Novipirellula artificiosorum]TWU34444.1 hypothetical protein Poly41_45920 [Novipirellula artificiosorum]
MNCIKMNIPPYLAAYLSRFLLPLGLTLLAGSFCHADEEHSSLDRALSDWKNRACRAVSMTYELNGTAITQANSIELDDANFQLTGKTVPPEDRSDPIERTLIYEPSFPNLLIHSNFTWYQLDGTWGPMIDTQYLKGNRMRNSKTRVHCDLQNEYRVNEMEILIDGKLVQTAKIQYAGAASTADDHVSRLTVNRFSFFNDRYHLSYHVTTEQCELRTRPLPASTFTLTPPENAWYRDLSTHRLLPFVAEPAN